MKRIILTLALMIVLALAYQSVRNYMLDAKNAQG